MFNVIFDQILSSDLHAYVPESFLLIFSNWILEYMGEKKICYYFVFFYICFKSYRDKNDFLLLIMSVKFVLKNYNEWNFFI